MPIHFVLRYLDDKPNNECLLYEYRFTNFVKYAKGN